MAIKNTPLVAAVQRVEARYGSVLKAPPAAMVPIWVLSKAAQDKGPHLTAVTRSQYTLVKMGCRHHWSINYLASLLGCKSRYAVRLANAYYLDRLIVKEGK